MRAFISTFALLLGINSMAWAVPSVAPTVAAPAATAVAGTTVTNTATATNTPAATNTPTVNKTPTAEDIAKDKAQQDAKVKALVKDQASRLQQLEKANLDALTQNQELQLKNDNLAVQVQVLQSESSAQMFLYGAATLAAGVILGFIIAGYIYTKRRRQW